MRHWIVLTLAVLLLAGCVAAATTTPVREVPQAEPFLEPTSTPDCQPFPGVTLEARRVNDFMAELHATGLEPGEEPYLIYSTFNSRGGTRVEENFQWGADENGTFSASLSGLMPLQGETSATWDIRLIHARGVECTTITLP